MSHTIDWILGSVFWLTLGTFGIALAANQIDYGRDVTNWVGALP